MPRRLRVGDDGRRHRDDETAAGAQPDTQVDDRRVGVERHVDPAGRDQGRAIDEDADGRGDDHRLRFAFLVERPAGLVDR